MRVSQISNYNIGFKGDNEKAAKGSYFKWVSQNQANNALLMTKGREERNGKLEFAKIISGLVGFGAATAAALLALNKKPQAAMGALIGSVAAIFTSTTINSANRIDALRTTEERGITKASVNEEGPRTVARAYSETAKGYEKNIVQN